MGSKNNHAQRQRRLINRGKGSKPLNQVKPVENINKRQLKLRHQNFLETRPVQMEVPPSYKLQGTAYEWQNPFELKEDDPSQKNYKKQLCLSSLSPIKQEYQENFIQGKIHNKKIRTKT